MGTSWPLAQEPRSNHPAVVSLGNYSLVLRLNRLSLGLWTAPNTAESLPPTALVLLHTDFLTYITS